MAGIIDFLRQLLQGQPIAGPAGPQGGAMPNQGGLMGTGGPFNQPGSFMQALGIPMAIMGTVEAARGRPVGAAYLEGIGGLLGEMGANRSQFATQSKTADAVKALIEKQFPNSKGLIEQANAVTQSDPAEGLKQMETLQKMLQGQAKAQKQEIKDINGVPYVFDPATGKLTKAAGNFPVKIETPDWLKHPLGATLYKMGIKNPGAATPQQVNDAQAMEDAEKTRQFEAHAKIAAKYGLVSVMNPDGSMGLISRSGASGRETRPAPEPKLPIALKADKSHEWDGPISGRFWYGTPTTPTTPSGKVAGALPGELGRFFAGEPELYDTVTKKRYKKGDIIPGFTVPWDGNPD